MYLKWCGQAGFLITSQGGTKILMDPFNKHLGYPVPRYEVDGITVSHNHYDHNYVRAALNHDTATIMRTEGEWQIGDIHLKSYLSFHDEVEGKERGENLIFILECEGIRIAHLGDLGHILPQEEQFYNLDVMLAPLGGRPYTISSEEALELRRIFQPRLFIPMHYKTKTLKYEFGDLSVLLEREKEIDFWDDDEIELTKGKIDCMQPIGVFRCFGL